MTISKGEKDTIILTEESKARAWTLEQCVCLVLPTEVPHIVENYVYNTLNCSVTTYTVTTNTALVVVGGIIDHVYHWENNDSKGERSPYTNGYHCCSDCLRETVNLTPLSSLVCDKFITLA